MSLNHFPYLPIVMNLEKQSMYPDGNPDRHINSDQLFNGQLPTFPENFMQIHLGSFCAKLLTNRQTDTQTNNDENISSLAELKSRITGK